MANRRAKSTVASPVKQVRKAKVNSEAMNGVTSGEYSGASYLDRHPTMIGSKLTMNEVSMIMRRCTWGEREAYVDLLDDLIEKDGSTYACMAQRVLSVTSSQYSIRENQYVEEEDKEKAKEVADFVRRSVHNIQGFRRSLQELQWHSMFYGLGSQEVKWDENAKGEIHPTRLDFVHSRRLQYPVQEKWDLYIADRGVSPSNAGTKQFWGVKVDKYPGKFIVHAPSIRGQYPTRDGLGRQLCIMMALKAMALRSASQTIERFAKPWAIAYYNTKSEETKGNPRVATTNGENSDVAKAERALQALGTGGLTYTVLPDSVELKPQENLTGSFTAELPQTIFIKYLDQQTARIILTTDEFTIAAGVGSQAKAEVLKRNLMQVLRYDAGNLADAITRDLIQYIVMWNFPPDYWHLIPHFIIQVQDAPALEQMVLAAEAAMNMSAPIDIEALCDEWNIPLTDDPEKMAKVQVDPNEELKAETTLEVNKENNKVKEKVASKTKAVAKKKALCYSLV
jgi:phage gp29-like protein